jgi:hypothetical protein
MDSMLHLICQCGWTFSFLLPLLRILHKNYLHLLEKLGRGFLGDNIKKVKKNLAQFFLLYIF